MNESNRLMKNVETRENFFVNLLNEMTKESHLKEPFSFNCGLEDFFFNSWQIVSFLFFRWSLVKNAKQKKNIYRWQRENKKNGKSVD